jgi:hypothetical protein
MSMHRQFATYLLGAALVLGTAPAWTQSTPSSPSSQDSGVKQDLKTAGQDTKDAAKDTGHAVKQGTKKTYHATKNGTKKAWNKTKNTTKGAAEGAKEGAKQPQ